MQSRKYFIVEYIIIAYLLRMSDDKCMIDEYLAMKMRTSRVRMPRPPGS